MEEWTSFPTGSLVDIMKPLGSHTNIKRTNGRQEQEFMTTLKRGGFVGLEKRQGKVARMSLAGNQSVRDSGQVSELRACGGG
jgi:hypothetical protein